MDLLKQISIEYACARLVSQYCFAIDGNHFEEWISLFTPDCQWLRQGQPAVLGHEGLKAFLAGRSKSTVTRHVSTNVQVNVVDDSHATGRSYTLLYAAAATAAPDVPVLRPLQRLIENSDEYLLVDGAWRIAVRVNRPCMLAAPAA